MIKTLYFKNDRIKFNLSFCGEMSAFADKIALPTPLSLYYYVVFFKRTSQCKHLDVLALPQACQ
jgi:hypothetical protein